MALSLNRSFVLILLIQYIAHYRVTRVIRKYTKLNRNRLNRPISSCINLT